MIDKDNKITKIIMYSRSVENLHNQKEIVSSYLEGDTLKTYRLLYRILLEEKIYKIEELLKKLQE